MTTALTNAYQSLKTCSFCSDVYNVSAKGVTWLSESASKLKASGGETLSKIASYVASFFTYTAAKIGSVLRAGKDLTVTAYGKCKDAFTALPKEAKIGGGLAVAAGLLAMLYFRNPEKKATNTEEAVVDAAAKSADKVAHEDVSANSSAVVADEADEGSQADGSVVNAQSSVDGSPVDAGLVAEDHSDADALNAAANLQEAPKE